MGGGDQEYCLLSEEPSTNFSFLYVWTPPPPLPVESRILLRRRVCGALIYVTYVERRRDLLTCWLILIDSVLIDHVTFKVMFTSCTSLELRVVHLCCVGFWKRKAVISLKTIFKRLVFVMQVACFLWGRKWFLILFHAYQPSCNRVLQKATEAEQAAWLPTLHGVEDGHSTAGPTILICSEFILIISSDIAYGIDYFDETGNREQFILEVCIR
jgi:hypothetical protein